MRTKTVSIRENRKYEHPDGDISCPLCGTHSDSMSHQLKCEVLVEGFMWPAGEVSDIFDIYSEDFLKQTKITQIFETLYKKRKYLLKHYKIIKNC